MKANLINTFLILVLLHVCLFTKAENYIATQDLNVRSGKGTGYSKIGVVHKGDVVDILDTTENWGKINYQGSDGFISVKFLQKGNSEAILTDKSKPNGFSNTFIWIIIGLVVIILIILRNTFIVRGLFGLIGFLYRAGQNGATTDSIFRSSGSRGSSERRQVYCIKCGQIKKPGDSSHASSYVGSNCSSGGSHNWKAS